MNSMGRPVRRGVGGFADGVRYVLRGLGWVARNPRQWLFGLIPALLALVLYIVALVLLGTYAGDLAAWATPFADGWNSGLRQTVRVLLGVVIFALGLVLSVLTFTAATLAIGEPFYEKLSERVEQDLGGLEAVPEVPLWRSIPRSLRDSVITLGYALMFTIPLFVLGFVPVVGQTVVPVLAAAVSGFFLTVELTALAMERRGLARKQRFAVLRGDKAPALGFGVLLFLMFLVPFGAVVAMPAAVAGATIMVRERLAPGPAAQGHAPRPVHP
ncbi:membrane protein [Sphaerisporangium krabiense]|uniref:CysZ protein n=1 Tax=Sphaerisporangium krabiense TaxID=763782 RepID=A0A7W8Z9W7_9ACTN|nr:EI24 domain-containing protein [Sphaerisporangium krabiense]MBB5630026.1 CysZ protein [Sphaerisporangium krabiense]GII64973.1 membrane protein [Sphaerisporangium krabiense]